MPLAPGKEFLFDETWPEPSGPAGVYMTANKVWYPLGSPVILLAAFAHMILEVLGG